MARHRDAAIVKQTPTPPRRKSILRYEHRSEPMLPRSLFLRRVALHASLATVFLLLSLLVGVLGYRFFAGLTWLDAFLNAAMILGGMGQVSPLPGEGGKVFASLYALYAGVAFLATFAVLVAPFAHRLLHRLHLDQEGRPR